MKKKYIYALLFMFQSHIFASETGVMTVETKIIEGDWELFDNCESFRWNGWSASEWCRNTLLNWGTFFGQRALQVYSTYTTGGAMMIDTHTFPLENWSSVELVRVMVYVQFPDDSSKLKLEPKGKADTWIEAVEYLNLPQDQWTDCVFNINQSLSGYQNVGRILFLPDNLGTNWATFYFDNLRLVMTDGTTRYWDVFDGTDTFGVVPRKWVYSADGYAYDDEANRVVTANAVTHTGSTAPVVNAKRIYMKWHKDKDPGSNEAKVETEEFYNLRKYVKIRGEFNCSMTTAQIAIGFWWSGGDWRDTGVKTVSVANQWQTLEWDLPQAPDEFWSNVKVIPLIKNTHEVETGEIYIDNIYFLK